MIGNVVIAKAIHFTSESECSRRYGQEKKKEWLEGTVTRVTVTRNEYLNRSARTAKAEYHLGGGTYKTKALLLRNKRVKEDS